jgi:hypothetical protein
VPQTHSLWEMKLLYIAILCGCLTSQTMRLLSEYIQETLFEVESNWMASVSGYTAVSLMDSNCCTFTKLLKSTPSGCGLGSIPQYRSVLGSNNLHLFVNSHEGNASIAQKLSELSHLTVPLSQAQTMYLLQISMENATFT